MKKILGTAIVLFAVVGVVGLAQGMNNKGPDERMHISFLVNKSDVEVKTDDNLFGANNNISTAIFKAFGSDEVYQILRGLKPTFTFNPKQPIKKKPEDQRLATLAAAASFNSPFSAFTLTKDGQLVEKNNQIDWH
jgi:hypothetical protein